MAIPYKLGYKLTLLGISKFERDAMIISHPWLLQCIGLDPIWSQLQNRGYLLSSKKHIFLSGLVSKAYCHKCICTAYLFYTIDI